MRRNDAQLGKPAVLYRDTKANIEALTGLAEGSIAYATDTNEDGTYDGSTWTWGRSGVGTTIPIVTSDPVAPDDGELWLLRETTGAIDDGTPIGLLLSLTYTDNAGSTAPLQLSVWDDVTNQIIRY